MTNKQVIGISNVIQEKDKGLIFAADYTPDGKKVVTANEYGVMTIYNAKTTKLLKQYRLSPSNESILDFAIKPYSTQSTYGKLYSDMENITMVSVGYAGQLKRMDLQTGKVLKDFSEEKNEIYALDYRYDGQYFASAGKDRHVRIYDERRQKLVETLRLGEELTSGKDAHINRIYALRFHPSNPHYIITAGWDHTVQVFDRRSGSAIRHFSNVYIAGSGLDIDHEGGVFCGSTRPHHQLQEFDFESTDLRFEYTIDGESKGDGKPHLMIHSLSLDPSNKMLLVGGTNRHDLQVYQRPTLYQNSKDKWIVKRPSILLASLPVVPSIHATAWQPLPKLHSVSAIAAGGDGYLYFLSSDASTWICNDDPTQSDVLPLN